MQYVNACYYVIKQNRNIYHKYGTVAPCKLYIIFKYNLAWTFESASQSADNVLFLLSYPQSTFEALLVKAVNWGDYLKELVDALLVIEVGKQFEGLLDLLPQRLCLETVMMERERGDKWFWEVTRLVVRNTRKPTITLHWASHQVALLDSQQVISLSDRLSWTRNPRIYFCHCQF